MRTLEYRVSGLASHPAVLFLHGFMGSMDDWQYVIDRLESEYQCIAVDLPGHGASRNFSDEDYAMEGASQLISRLLDDLLIRRCAFVGYSMGGRLALYTAFREPQRCSRLILESASPGLKTEAERLTRRNIDEVRAARLESVDFDTFLEEWYHQQIFTSLRKNVQAFEEMITRRRNNDPHELARVLRGMSVGKQPSLWERLCDLKIPTLTVVGALDGKFVEIAESMAVLTDNIRVATVPDTGHNLHIEHPEAYVELIKDFLKLIT